MTPEQQRIKIAEACGWTCCGQVEGCQPHGLHPMFKVDDYRLDQIMNMEVPICDLPDYLNDLNAIHEAEKACLTTIPLVTDYGIRLVNALHREHKKNQKIQNTSWCIPFVGNCGWFATAKQRAEAFLKTLNLWTE